MSLLDAAEILLNDDPTKNSLDAAEEKLEILLKDDPTKTSKNSSSSFSHNDDGTSNSISSLESVSDINVITEHDKSQLEKLEHEEKTDKKTNKSKLKRKRKQISVIENEDFSKSEDFSNVKLQKSDVYSIAKDECKNNFLLIKSILQNSQERMILCILPESKV